MATTWFDRYLNAWLLHPVAGSPGGGDDLRKLLNCCSPDIRYEDVPTATVYEGHGGIERMCMGAYNWSSDVKATAVLTRLTSGKLFSVETEWKGTSTTAIGDLPATGRSFVLRQLSVGATDDQGLVTHHRDYWDLASFLAQTQRT
jgi:hypothetical protein